MSMKLLPYLFPLLLTTGLAAQNRVQPTEFDGVKLGTEALGYSLQGMARELPANNSFFATPVGANGVEISWESGDTLFTRRAEYLDYDDRTRSYGEDDGKGVIKLTNHAIWGDGYVDPIYGDYSESRTVEYLEPNEQPILDNFDDGPKINHNASYVGALLKNILDVRGILRNLVGKN